MPRFSAAFSRFRFPLALLLLCQIALVGQACSMGSSSTGSQYRVPQATVHFEEVADWSFEAAHPAVIDQATIKQILRGVYVGDRSSSHTSSADGSKPMRAFSDEDVEYLAPLLAHALSQAQPEYVVAFRLSSSAGSGSEPTAGTLYVQDQQVYVTLTAYQGDLGKTASPLLGQGTGRTISFSPESAAHTQKAEPTVALGQRDLVTLAIDYNVLGRQSDPAPIEPSAPVAAKSEAKAPERILMASAVSDDSTTADMAAASEAEAVSRKEQELKAAHQTIVRKDAKIDQLRRDLESMRQQLEAKDNELRQVKSKPASAKREKRGTAELVIR